MLKKNKWGMILSSLVILLPIGVGLLLWDQLPEQLPFHWNAAGEVDGWIGKSLGVFLMPGILLIVHWLCVLVTGLDPKNKDKNEKAKQLILWIMPVLSLLVNGLIYATALGREVNVDMLMPGMMGVLFVVLGNILPKCSRNSTIGIKIPWTLNSEENWNKTHRFAGWLWTVCGIIIMLTGFFGGFWIFFVVMLLMVLAPVLYSYILHRKGM